MSDLGDAFRLQGPPAHLLLWPERRVFTMFPDTPLSRCGFLSLLSFFLNAALLMISGLTPNYVSKVVLGMMNLVC